MNSELKNSVTFIKNKAGKKTGFSTPPNYFNNLEDVIAIKLAEKNIPKKQSFEVPENYFNNLEKNILSKTLSHKKEIKTISFKERVLKIIPFSAAASIILFIGLNTFVFNTSEKKSFDNLTDTEVEKWVANNINLISSNDIVLTYNDIEFDTSEIIPNSISDDELENYLTNQDNISLILENE